MARKTKLIVTVGPATETPEVQRLLIAAGANVFRLNMSHAPPEVARKMATQLREVASSEGTEIALLMDLQGPAIRTGELPASFDLKAGDAVEIRQPDAEPRLPFSTTVNYPGLGRDLRVGATVLVDNGVLQFRVVSKDDERVTCQVMNPGLLGSRRHINLPGTRVNLPALTEKDRTCVALAAEIGVDFVAMSFARDALHIRELKALIASHGSSAQVVAKIEDQSAVQVADEIIQASDALMVARGDLGIEVPIEELPLIQRRLVRKCVHMGKPVIVATHMLESMISSPVPTRAEMTDVSNAVIEQADALMLSGETSVGKFPVACVEILDRIARRTESLDDESASDHADLRSDKQKLVRSAILLADSIDGARILVFTKRGVMGGYAAHLRPLKAPIYAFTPTVDVARSLLLRRGLTPFVLAFTSDDPHASIASAVALLRRQALVKTGDPLVIVSDVLTGEFVTDSILLRRV